MFASIIFYKKTKINIVTFERMVGDKLIRESVTYPKSRFVFNPGTFSIFNENNEVLCVFSGDYVYTEI